MSENLLSERYGRKENPKRQRAIVMSLAAVLLASFLTWAIASALATSNQVKHRDLSYEILGPTRAQLIFEVTKPAGRAVSCQVQVLNQNFAIVGFKSVEIAAQAKQTRVISVEINTTELGVTSLVDNCR